jgi:excisionase family DNA binding protein
MDYQNANRAVDGDPSATSGAGDESSPVLTVEELAVLLRINRKTAYSAVRAGEIPGVRKVGGVIRVHRDTVLAWLAQGTVRGSRSRRNP